MGAVVGHVLSGDDLADDWEKKFFWSDGSTIAKASTS
jgi:hypothetical protein